MAATARPLVTVHNLDSDMATDGSTITPPCPLFREDAVVEVDFLQATRKTNMINGKLWVIEGKAFAAPMSRIPVSLEVAPTAPAREPSLNPYAKTARRMALLAEEQRVKAKKEKLDKKRKQISKLADICHASFFSLVFMAEE
ncbi:ribosomal protein L4/L1 family [Actinidia rufa]|uniref:Ribosomal protein L4/L1 family n=1 Tax=Actinidia rufa TaxID=165716 RepID=A0A7J0DJZ6_9ERIC|nr:ribosomal protein L4/L1 family [Actinidia rufa]